MKKDKRWICDRCGVDTNFTYYHVTLQRVDDGQYLPRKMPGSRTTLTICNGCRDAVTGKVRGR